MRLARKAAAPHACCAANIMKPNKDEIIQVGVEEIVVRIREALGPALFDACERMGVDAETIIRYAPLADSFKAARTQLNLTIKEVAAQLKETQYKIKAIEKGEFRQFDVDVFHKYCHFLQLDEYVEAWSHWHSALASQLGISGQSAAL